MNHKVWLKYIFYVCTGLLVLMTLLMWGFAPEFIKVNAALSVLAVICVGSVIALEYQSLLTIVRSSYFKNAIADGVNLFLVFAILGLVNYLVFMNNKSVDITETKVHTLSEQSRSIIANFDDEIKITLFAKRSEWEAYLELLNQYKLVNQNIVIKAVDVEENPALAKVQGISETGSILINYKDKKIIGKASNELEITNTLLKLQRSRSIKVGFTYGHGEIDLFQADKNGGTFLKNRLIERNYHIAKVDLLGVEEIPSDVDLLLVLGPNKGLLDLEVEKVKKYLDKGGSLFFAFGPNFDNLNWQNMVELLAKNGANITNTIVLDRLSKVQGSEATIPIITTFNPESSITKNVKGRLLFPLTSAITKSELENVEYRWLARSSTFPASWAESDLVGVVKGTATVSESDIQGPVDVAVSLENKKNYSKIVVWGSAASLVNAYQSNSLNFNLFFNTAAWAMDDEGIMAISRPGIRGQRIFLAPAQLTLIFWGAIVLIPFCLSALGVFFYRRRLVK